jgi:Flp pilus assembly protein TadD
MEEGKVHVRFGRLALGGMLLALILALAACGGSSPRHESAEKAERAREHGESASERAREAEELKSGHRTLFESDRRPDHTPAIEAVEDRAYPRTYVETSRALAGRKAAARARARFAVRRARAKTRAAAAAWQEAGPFTPTVPARVT